jgi:quercetin dioxygenase-like cupin family protein
MEMGTSGSTSAFTGRSRSISTSLKQFDLPSLIEKMKDSRSWKNGELKTLTLLNAPGRQIVLTALHEGTEVDSFQTCDSITFQIVEGRILFRTSKESQFIDEGQTLTLYENIKYSFTASEESVVLLTLANCN